MFGDYKRSINTPIGEKMRLLAILESLGNIETLVGRLSNIAF
jgi:hypothetical protein